MIGIVLSLALLQSPPDKVALVFADRTEIVTVAAAEQEYAALERLGSRDNMAVSRHAALVVALGTQPTTRAQTCPDTHAPRCETMRGRRVPLQSASREDK